MHTNIHERTYINISSLHHIFLHPHICKVFSGLRLFFFRNSSSSETAHKLHMQTYAYTYMYICIYPIRVRESLKDIPNNQPRTGDGTSARSLLVL